MFRFYESLLNFSFFRESLGNLPEGVGHLDLEVGGGVGLAGQQYLKGVGPLDLEVDGGVGLADQQYLKGLVPLI